MITFRTVVLVLCILLIQGNTADPTVVIHRYSEKLDLTRAATKSSAAIFLIKNSSETDFTLFFSFQNACNIKHFTTNKQAQLQKVQLRIDSDPSSDLELWDRTTNGGDCLAVMSWSPAGPVFKPIYHVEVLFDWNASSSFITLAGSYSETFSVIAVEN